MEERVLFIKLTPTGKAPEIEVYKAIKKELDHLDDFGYIKNVTVEGPLTEVPTERLHR